MSDEDADGHVRETVDAVYRSESRRVLVGDVDDREAAQVLLGLDERAVGEHGPAAGRVDAEDRALVAHAVVGQAQGIIMERYEMSAGEALLVLRRIADRTGNQVSEIAAHLVDTRRIPR